MRVKNISTEKLLNVAKIGIHFSNRNPQSLTFYKHRACIRLYHFVGGIAVFLNRLDGLISSNVFLPTASKVSNKESAENGSIWSGGFANSVWIVIEIWTEFTLHHKDCHGCSHKTVELSTNSHWNTNIMKIVNVERTI